MSFKIVRNDITKMTTEAIVNTANANVEVGSGCDYAVYQAAGYDALLNYRKKHIGISSEGEAFITPGFDLKSKYIIHTISPLYIDGNHGEEEKLRSCYRKSLELAKDSGIKEIAFPLISTGGFGYPKEEGMRIAFDEIQTFLCDDEMDIYLVVFDSKATKIGEHIFPDLEAYIDHNYVCEKREEEYGDAYYASYRPSDEGFNPYREENERMERRLRKNVKADVPADEEICRNEAPVHSSILMPSKQASASIHQEEELECLDMAECVPEFDFEEEHESKLDERMKHMSDSFSQYLLFLIQNKEMKNADVYKRAIVDKKTFSKIKNNPEYHPQKMTALCLCIGAKLNLDESKDLLARAGYALSPCDLTDIVFSYFIENKIYDMIELDIQLEEHGLPCIIA